MQALLNGIYWGLILAVLVGPVLFILVQAGIERGFRAGVVIASGMWVGDLLFVLLTYFGLSHMLQASEWAGFESTLGLVGGAILVSLGIATCRSKAPVQTSETSLSDDYPTLWLKGLVLNTINPFCVFYWVMISSTVVSDNYQTSSQAAMFYAGIIGTIVTTDCLKVYLAKELRRWLTIEHVKLVRHGTGLVLLFVGLGFVFRTVVL